MAWLAVTGVVRCGDNGHYEVFYLYIWDERLFIPFYLFMTEKNGSDIVIFINGRIEMIANFASRCSLDVSNSNMANLRLCPLYLDKLSDILGHGVGLVAGQPQQRGEEVAALHL